MTTKMKVILVVATTVLAVFCLLRAPYALSVVDQVDQLLSAVANALDLHEAPKLSALAVFVIPGLYMYLAFTHRRHP